MSLRVPPLLVATVLAVAGGAACFDGAALEGHGARELGRAEPLTVAGPVDAPIAAAPALASWASPAPLLETPRQARYLRADPTTGDGPRSPDPIVSPAPDPAEPDPAEPDPAEPEPAEPDPAEPAADPDALPSPSAPTPTDQAGSTTVPDAPRGFSWVEADLAAMAWPGSGAMLAASLDFLSQQDIDLIVTLTVAPLDEAVLANYAFATLHIPVVDFTAPTFEQMDSFVAAVAAAYEAGQRVLVHCAGGRGRTGTMLASWFIANGEPAAEAIAHVRRLRPGSIETVSQEEALYQYDTR